jgi:hypothetical protein
MASKETTIRFPFAEAERNERISKSCTATSGQGQEIGEPTQQQAGTNNRSARELKTQKKKRFGGTRQKKQPSHSRKTMDTGYLECRRGEKRILTALRKAKSKRKWRGHHYKFIQI